MATAQVSVPAIQKRGTPDIVWKAGIPILVWLVLVLWGAFLGPPAGLKINAWYFFAMFISVILGLILEPIPAAATGMIGITVGASMRYVNADITQSVNWALGGFADTTVWLIFGAFVFSMGYNKTGLGRRIALLLVRWLGGRTLGLGYAIALADLVIAPGTPSNTARSAGTIFPVIRNIPGLYDSEPNSPSARKIGSYIMWTAFAVTCVTSSMFITSLAPAAAALAIVKNATKVDVNWLQYAQGFLPVGIVLFLLVPLLVFLIYPPEVKMSKEIPQWAGQELDKLGKVTSKELIMVGLVVLALFLWITGSNTLFNLPYLGTNFINATTVVLVGVVLMIATQIVTWDDVLTNKSAWNVLVWFATLVTLANGLNQVGFVGWFANNAAAPLMGLDPLVVLVVLVALFYFIHYFFASLTAHTTAVLPLVLGVGLKLLPATMIAPFALLCVYSLGLIGVLTPYATGPSPVYYGSGYISRGDFWKLGLIFGVIFFAGLVIIGVPYLLNFKL